MSPRSPSSTAGSGEGAVRASTCRSACCRARSSGRCRCARSTASTTSARPRPTRALAAVTDLPLTEEEKSQIRERLQVHEIEHHDLDDVIARLARDASLDRLQLQRLKKRKLILKDQIQRLRARLIPDIIA